MTSVCSSALAVSNAVLPSYRRGSGREAKVEAPAAEGEGGGCGRRGEAGRRRRRAPHPPLAPCNLPLTPLFSALCAIAHLVLEARVGPRLEQHLDAGSVAYVGREVQRCRFGLRRRGGGPHTRGGVSGGGRRAGGV